MDALPTMYKNEQRMQKKKKKKKNLYQKTVLQTM
jgi:hypothetical protein